LLIIWYFVYFGIIVYFCIF